MKIIKILCIYVGIFLCNTTIQTGEAVVWGERLNMAFDMGMPMGVGMAASNANQFISEEQAAVFSDFTLESSAITNALKSWSAKQGALIQEQMTAVGSYFSTQLTAINNSQANAQKNAQAEANYLFQNLSLAQPASSLISLNYGGQFDQMFTNGIMATPISNFNWYNVLGIGDWVYDPLSKSFWQNQAIPFPPTDPNPITDASNISVDSGNNIFVEYYPSQKPYTISGSFTLYKITYPFFTGIMFNKNRWISGNIDGENKCRVLGIYATSAKTAGIYFAEEYDNITNSSDTTPIKIPLLQIMKGLVTSLAPISEQIITNVNSEPVTFNFKITTNPTTASCKIWAATDKEPAKAFLIQNLNSEFYIYHTLGFMSPGAATEWKIKTPTELTFSPQALINFKNKVFSSKN